MLEREVLLGPDIVARAALGLVKDPAQRWMLGQPQRVRRSFVREVLDRGDGERDRRAWMLRQPDAVRHSYLKIVLGPDAPPEVRWLLTQPQAVRESYVRDVLS